MGTVSSGIVSNPVFTSATVITTDTNWTSGSGWEITADSTNNSTTKPGWKAFDNTWETSNEQNMWHSAETATSTSSPKWLKIKYPSAYKAIQYSIQIRDLSYPRYPKTWKFQGSNNDSDWTDLDTQTNKTDWAGNNTVMFTFSNSTAYQYYRVYITATDTSDSDGGCCIRELKVYTSATGSQVGNLPVPGYTYPNTVTVDSALSGTSITIANDSHQVSGGKWYTLNHSTYAANRFIFWDNAIGYWSYFDTQGNRPDRSWGNSGGTPGRFNIETDGDLKLFHGSNGSTMMHIKPNSSSNPWPSISGSPSLNFDTYNKLTVANVDSDATSNIDFFSNTYEMGSRKELIINDAGTYYANIYSSNTLALVKKYVNHLFPTTETQKIVASVRQTYDHFGRAVSISGDYAIVGAFTEDHDADDDDATEVNNAGSAYIFKRDGNSWVQQQKIVASDRGAGDTFGHSVSINGDYAIVGSREEDHDASGGNLLSNAGSAYIFKRDGNSWVQQQKIVASDRGAGDRFGYAVSINGDYAIVAAFTEDHDANGANALSNAGSAYIFKRSGTTWTQETKLVANDRGVEDRFGWSVSIYGDYAIVGSVYEDHDASGANYLSNAGSAYIFRRDGNSWVQQQKIVANDRGEEDQFGYSVSINGDYAIVGALEEDHDANGANELIKSGSAYIFKRSGTTWVQETKLVASDREAGDYFGWSVSIDGDSAIVGAAWEEEDASGGNSLTKAGSAYIFRRSGTIWTQETKIAAGVRKISDNFGRSVDISGGYAIVGARYEDEDATDGNLVNASGSAYIFERPAIGPETNPFVNYRSVTKLDAGVQHSSFQAATICFWAKALDTGPTYFDGFNSDRGFLQLTIQETYTHYASYGVINQANTSRIQGYTGTSGNSVYSQFNSPPYNDGYDPAKWNFYIVYTDSNGGTSRIYLPEFDWTATSTTYGRDHTWLRFDIDDDYVALTDVSVYTGNPGNTDSWRTTLYNGGQIGGAANESTNRVHYFRFHKDNLRDNEGTAATDISSSAEMTTSENLPGEFTAPPSLTFDGYNKLTLENFDSMRQWPPTDGTRSSPTWSDSDKVADWTITGASYGNGSYKGTSSVAVWSDSSNHAGPYWAFNNDDSTAENECWHPQSIVVAILTIEMPSSMVLGSYELYYRNYTSYTEGPKDWTVEGSNDGSTWTVLDTRTNQPQVSAALAKIGTYTVSNSTSYSKYRLNVTANHGGSQTTIGEWKMFSNDLNMTLTKTPDSWDVGTASNVYIDAAGTYDAQAKNSNTFVIKTSNVVSAPVTRKLEWKADGTETQIVYASDGSANNNFGRSCAMWGSYMIVGSFEGSSNTQGAIYIYKKESGTWTFKQKISGEGANDYFSGYGAVDIHEDTIIVGAYKHGTNNNTGKAYIYTRSGETWSLESSIVSDDLATDDKFGISVSVHGDYAVVGAQLDDGPSQSGAGYIFYRNGTSWSQQQKLNPGASDENVGTHVSIYGDYVVLSGKRSGSDLRGRAHVYKRTGTSWGDHTVISNPNPASNDAFSERLSITDGYVAIGSDADDPGGTSDAGQVYVFKHSGTNDWTLEATLEASDKTSSMRFASGISMTPNVLVVGAHQEGTGGANAGAAYIFERSGTTWTEVKKVVASDAAAGDRLGIYVGVNNDGSSFVAGAYGESTNGASAGAAYVYEKQYVGPTLTYDTSNKLSLTGVTTPSSNLTVGTNTYDIGSASNVYIKDQGTYKFHTNDGDQALIMNKTVSSDPSGTTYNFIIDKTKPTPVADIVLGVDTTGTSTASQCTWTVTSSSSTQAELSCDYSTAVLDLVNKTGTTSRSGEGWNWTHNDSTNVFTLNIATAHGASDAHGSGTLTVAHSYIPNNTFQYSGTLPSQVYDNTKTITVSNIPSTQTGITGKFYKGATAYTIHATEPTSNVIIKNTGSYVSVFTTSSTAYLTNTVNVNATPTTTSDDNTIEDEALDVTTTTSVSKTIAFHDGLFADSDDPHGDGSITAAATAGHVYSDTATGTYTWGTLVRRVYRYSRDGDTIIVMKILDIIMVLHQRPVIRRIDGHHQERLNQGLEHSCVAGGGGGGADTGGGGGAGGYLAATTIESIARADTDDPGR